MADVAHEAGVSASTVSYVLSGTNKQTIAPQTRDRVLEAAARLGYSPNVAAQALARGRSNIVVFEMPQLPSGEIGHTAARRVAAGLGDLGYTVVDLYRDNQSWHTQLLQNARNLLPAAVITVLPVSSEIHEDLRRSGVPAVSSLFSNEEGASELIEDLTRCQVDFLAQRGHRSILFFPLSTNVPEIVEMNRVRARAGAETATERGLSWTEISPSTSTEEAAKNISAAWELSPNATAIASYNDDAALIALSALQKLGVEVPAQMALIGGDNRAFGVSLNPKLTTVGYEHTFKPAVRERLRILAAVDRTVLMDKSYGSTRVRIVERETT